MALLERSDLPAPAPILKWAGGKKQLLPVILPRLPDRVRTYFEPFIGGGAVFFAMAHQQRFERAVISDKNLELVNLYTQVRDDVGGLIRALGLHVERATDSDWFYEVRSWSPTDLEPAERAARLVFLNRTCFNGLYRVNRKGAFNVPFGRYKKPRVLDEAKLRSAAEALRGVDIRAADFSDVAAEARTGDAVYFDPPYVPVSPTSSFHAYHAEAFGAEAHRRLVDVYRRCWRRGAVAVLSNSDCAFSRQLYAPLDVEVVRATRAINSAPSRRGAVNELLAVGPKRRASKDSSISSPQMTAVG